ncbi:hypothetical protein K1719_002688 [Acacia pycnantha]|nr:hypothetical protein K1719_002688 [Acacia pycnantha]
MLVAIMRAYDPPTNQFEIKGKTHEILGKDVAQLLGVPYSGDKVIVDVSDTNPVYQRLRKDYGKMKYDDILNVITSGEVGDQFEMLFMLHMLGTFLAPTSSTTLDDKFLKVLKDLHGKLMGIINDSHKRLVATMEDELRKAQVHIEIQRKQQVSEGEDDGHDGDDDDQHGHRDGDADGEASYDDDATMGMPINISEFDGESPTVEGGTNKGQQYIGPYPVEQQDAPRRLQWLKKPKNMSPWTLTKPLKCPRKAKEKKEIFFDIISGTCTKDEIQKILIEINDEDITWEQLQTRGSRNRLSNRTLLAGKPLGWKVAEWKHILLPDQLGYNIADCDLLMGPMLVDEQWFYMALDPRTMNFYVLDSMKTKVYMSKNESSKMNKSEFANPQAMVINKIVCYRLSSFSYD